jgi:predicted dehydrogenase
VRLAAVASRNPETASLVPVDCRIVADWHELIAAPEIDGIVIASPPSSHADILLAAAAAGKAVLVEKPLVQSQADAERIRRALESRDAIVLVDHTMLFHPAVAALQREIGSAPIRAIRASAGSMGPFRGDVSVLWDWLPHDMAMSLTLAPGPAQVVRAARSKGRGEGDAVGESLVVDLMLAGGIPAELAVSNMVARHRWFAVELATGTFVFRDYVPDKLIHFAPGEDIHGAGGRAVPVAGELPLTRAVREFAERIRAGNADRGSVALGLAVVGVLAEIERRLEA